MDNTAKTAKELTINDKIYLVDDENIDYQSHSIVGLQRHNKQVVVITAFDAITFGPDAVKGEATDKDAYINERQALTHLLGALRKRQRDKKVQIRTLRNEIEFLKEIEADTTATFVETFTKKSPTNGRANNGAYHQSGVSERTAASNV